MIRGISQMNNQAYESMLNDHQNKSTAQLKSMEKWLKTMNKIFSMKENHHHQERRS